MNSREPVHHTGALGLPAMEPPRGRHRRRALRDNRPSPWRPRRQAHPVAPAAGCRPTLGLVQI